MEPVNLFDYEAIAQTKLERALWDFFQGGSDDEVTLRDCRAAFERIKLRPRVLVDVSAIDVRTTVLGTPVAMPILIAPTASHCVAHPDGECATAQAAGRAHTLMIASTVATRAIEEIAQAASGPLWFQLYAYPTFEVAEMLVRRAEAAGYRAIVLTVDLPILGNREKDRRNNATIPPFPYQEANFAGIEKRGQQWVSLTWDSIAWLRSITSLPVILKGILTEEDARLAVEHGIEGIVVTNHGGRQLDTAVPSIEALPEIVNAVAGRCEVYLDGGIRRGTDILKALALGARAVLIGRPVLWGLAANGADGVYGVLELLRQELERAMALSGRPTLASIDRSLVRM
ncbi:MAG TPA: alpha-hydroxy acid oxidase [Ktedonobacteraceae bacterium]|nr:alpha-hydroxy acid oxidase [Ktedonobacteraceae bacterium]